eukprot:TRINITY_DN7584_c0_g1_i1.p1 TRINITY_DN7584_c0_g1~~TRINITY_DN7584_c0_g1_i1.p1  ORF type:complete len:1741 (-),score=240.11 TRINITY_DN7584_c0_g1_i1:66-5117(-)
MGHQIATYSATSLIAYQSNNSTTKVMSISINATSQIGAFDCLELPGFPASSDLVGEMIILPNAGYPFLAAVSIPSSKTVHFWSYDRTVSARWRYNSSISATGVFDNQIALVYTDTGTFVSISNVNASGTRVISSYLYSSVISQWTLLSVLTGVSYPGFGTAIAVKSPYLAVGAPDYPNEDGSTGIVVMYKINSGFWIEQSRIYPPYKTTRFGANIILSSNQIFIWSAGTEGTNTSSVATFTINLVTGAWLYSQKLSIYAWGTNSSQFGQYMSLSSTELVLAISAPAASYYNAFNYKSGLVMTYTKCDTNDTLWVPRSRIFTRNSNISMAFGSDLAVDRFLLIGATNSTRGGEVYASATFCNGNSYGPTCKLCSCSAEKGFCDTGVIGTGACSRCLNAHDSGPLCDLPLLCNDTSFAFTGPNGFGLCSACSAGFYGDAPTFTTGGFAVLSTGSIDQVYIGGELVNSSDTLPIRTDLRFLNKSGACVAVKVTAGSAKLNDPIGGFIGSLTIGLSSTFYTDRRWKCTAFVNNTPPDNWYSCDYSDLDWPYAMEIKTNPICSDQRCAFIWTEISENHPYTDATIFCRRTLGGFCNVSCTCNGECINKPGGKCVANLCNSGYYPTSDGQCLPCSLCINGVCNTSVDSNGYCAYCTKNNTYGQSCVDCECKNGVCNANVTGDGRCLSCNEGFYGPFCAPCTCTANGVCDNSTVGSDGLCLTCQPGYYGVSCGNMCSKNCSANELCDDGTRGTGKCECIYPYFRDENGTCSCTALPPKKYLDIQVGRSYRAKVPRFGDQFGYSLSSYNTMVAVGSPFGKVFVERTGIVTIFNITETTTDLLYRFGPDTRDDTALFLSGDRFGQSLSMFENTLAVGSPFHSPSFQLQSSGAVFVFVIDTNSTTPVTQAYKLMDPNPIPGSSFGSAVKVVSNFIVVGANRYSSTGKMYIFRNLDQDASLRFTFDGTDTFNKFQNGMITATTLSLSSQASFGSAIDSNSFWIAVGAPQQINDSSDKPQGAVLLFYRPYAAHWVQYDYLIPPTHGDYSLFGSSLAMDDTTLVVGAYGTDWGQGSDQGAVHIYVLNGLKWELRQTIQPLGLNEDDSFGYSVSLNGNFLIVGAYHTDSANSIDAGSAYLYMRDCNGTWIEYAKILGSQSSAKRSIFETSEISQTIEANIGINFGTSLSIVGNKAVFGSPGDLQGAGSFSTIDLVCKPGFYGPDCLPCPCDLNHSSCDDGVGGSGKCTCFPNYFGKNCSSPCTCLYGSCNDGVNGNGQCLKCSDNTLYFGDNCLNCTCNITNGMCDGGVLGNGECSECYNSTYEGKNCDRLSIINAIKEENTTLLISIVTPVALVVVISVLVLIIVIVYLKKKSRRNNQGDLSRTDVGKSLPSAVRYFFELNRMEKEGWEKMDESDPPYWRRELDSSSLDYKKMSEFFYEYLGGGSLKVKKAWGIYNPGLASNFATQRSLLQSRIREDPHLFAKNSWATEDASESDAKLRKWVKSSYDDMVSRYFWNNNEEVPIIPLIHGTDGSIAWKIARKGFASMSSLDAGYYGSGIYFSSSALYTLPYFGTKKSPTILICLVFPGNTYPTIEDRNGPNSLLGKPIKPGYQSHYVLTNRSGSPCTQEKESGKFYDELVIPQESQIVPVFLLEIDNSNLYELSKKFQRDVADNGLADNGPAESREKILEEIDVEDA